jgi:hypothetical protein
MSQTMSAIQATAPKSAQKASALSFRRPDRNQLSAAIAQAAIDPENDHSVDVSDQGWEMSVPKIPWPAEKTANSTQLSRSIQFNIPMLPRHRCSTGITAVQ